jgi:phospholipid/cholesterol/gamma-HCH transport system substrate-binding protein
MKRRTDVWVGLVVLAVATLLIVAIAWVKQTDISGHKREVVAQFHDVGNARVGNAVVIRGVVGGRIQAIELASGGWVNARMRIDPSVRLPADPVVLLNESSLFGEWQATIVERTALPHDDALEREIALGSRDRGVLPGATLPGIGKLTAVAGQIAGDVATVAGRVETAFDDQASRELRESIRSVSQLSTTLAQVVRAHASDLDSLSRETRNVVSSLKAAAGTARLTAERIDSAASSPGVRQAVEDLSVASTELRRTAVQVRELSTRFANTQGRLETVLTTSDSVFSKINHGQGSLGLLVNDPGMYRHTDSLVTQLRDLLADIKSNPKKYLTVRLF